MSQVIIKDEKLLQEIIKATPRALNILAEQVINDSNSFVPRLTGDLRTYVSPDSRVNTCAIVYNTKYAEYQWYGIGMHHYTTAGTGAEWCEVARNKYGDSWVTVLKNAINKETGIR